MSQLLTLHHLEYSQSFRVLWMLEELGTPYELIVYERDAKTRAAPDEYKAISPLGTAPVLTEGEMALAESSAIMEHILDITPNHTLRPEPGAPDRIRYLFWWHAAQGSMMPLQLMITVLNLSQKQLPFFMKPFIKLYVAGLTRLFMEPRLNRLMEQAEVDLETAPWFGGERLSVADFLIAYNMIVGAERGMINERQHPNCMKWIARMKALPSFARATEKDGRASMALNY
ncbi:MAG: glutathione S-transferase [Luminiphilus sp.]|nr:glutathione S-transferase [Luminiphilus sp.]